MTIDDGKDGHHIRQHLITVVFSALLHRPLRTYSAALSRPIPDAIR